MTEAHEWLEAHRGQALTADWYIQRDADSLAQLAEQGIDPTTTRPSRCPSRSCWTPGARERGW